MDWKKYYNDRLISAEEAANKIKSGDRVVFGHATGEPSGLIDAIVANKDAYRDVEIVHMVCMGKGEYMKPEMAGHFRHNSIFVGGAAREAIASGRADYTPIYFSKIPSLFLEDYLPTDVAVIQVSSPDKHGWFSLGVSVDYAKAAIEKAKTVVVQVNKYMPRTHGDSFVHASEIDWFVELDRPLIELPPGPITEVEEAIGSHVASLIEDGATLQLGIGSLPDAVLKFLTNKKDLGIHSEMISDGLVDLIESGVVNNTRKTLHKGKIVVTFLMGTKKLYDFVDDNPLFYAAPSNYVNDPYVASKNDNLISINSCVQVDLMGQVCSESVGLKQISAVGGQVDFVRAANMSRGGMAIIAMPSTAAKGKISKIVPFLDEGAAITTNRNDVRYIITEYGIADMRYKTLRDRAKALIKIAHPDFRPQLEEEFEKRFKMKMD